MVEKRGVVGIVDCFGYVLLGRKQEGEKDLSGRWHIPGETLDEGEDEIMGLTRGFREEASLEIVVDKLMATTLTPSGTRLNWYLCRPKAQGTIDQLKIKAGSDLAELKWVARYEVPMMSDAKAIERWPQEVREFFGYR